MLGFATSSVTGLMAAPWTLIYPSPPPGTILGLMGSPLPRAARRAKCGFSSSLILTGDPETSIV